MVKLESNIHYEDDAMIFLADIKYEKGFDLKSLMSTNFDIDSFLKF